MVKRTPTAAKRKTPAKRPKRKAVSVRLPMQRQFDFPEPSQGRFFNVRDIFDKLNTHYFRNRLRGYAILWGRQRERQTHERHTHHAGTKAQADVGDRGAGRAVDVRCGGAKARPFFQLLRLYRAEQQLLERQAFARASPDDRVTAQTIAKVVRVE